VEKETNIDMKQRKNVMRVSAWNTIGRLLVAGCFAVVAVFLTGLISPDASSAAVTPPNKMNFQGRLTDASGNPLTGTYDMQFKLYSAASGGTLLWAETRTAANSNAVTVTSGLFSVRLGEGTLVAPSTQLSAVVAANSTLYFEITIGSDAAMTPRSQLATSAYAFNSDTLDGIDSSGFIQNTTTQQTANFNISGTGQAATFQASTSVISTLFDTGSATALNIGTTNATVINLNKNVTVAAGKTLTLAGGTTASRPASPAEGALYYDTSTKQLVVYANGKWQADRTTSTKIVAASNAPQALKDGADYVATGSGDEATINTALAAAAGGKVYLTEGTYTIYDSISIPNNTVLAGAGAGTVITFPNGFGLDRSAIVNTDTATGTGITIRDLKIDGNNANISMGNGNGIYLTGVGSDTSGSVRAGAVITNVIINNLYSGASLASTIALDGTYNTSITDSTLGSGNLYIRGSHNIVSNNYLFDSQQVGVYIDGTSHDNTITDNSIQNTELWGIYLYSATFTTISGNRITNTGGTTTNDAIYLDSSDNTTITSNTIDDNSATTNNYAINIATTSADNNYLADNNIWGASVNDAGTGTIYGGQVTSATGSYLLKPAGTINLSQNVIVAAGKSLTLLGGNTASRPASPTEGMLYYDTSTKQLLVYSNGKWQSDSKTASVIVAASNSPQAVKDGAQYIATGTNDQTIINNALTAAAGGKVYLAEGTYTISASISIPNNTMLAGAGTGTIVTIPNSFSADINAITNTTTGGGGTGITVQDLSLDGNQNNQTAGTMRGVYMTGVGSGSGTSAVQGARIIHVSSYNWRGAGISFNASSNNIVDGNTVRGNTINGITLGSTTLYTTVSNNIVDGNTSSGIIVSTSSNGNIVTTNVVKGNGAGIRIDGGSVNNIVSANKLYDNGGATDNNAIYIDAADSNNITGNDVSDSSATSTNYAINILNSTSDTNYLANNTLSGGSINDLGTGTVYGGQVNGSNSYAVQPAGTIELMKNTNITGTLSVSGATTVGSPLSVGQTAGQQISLSSGPGNHGIEIGRTDGTATTPFIDFHAGATATDYDSRIIATSGTGTGGRGGMNILAGTITLGTSDANASLLVLDTKTSAGDPSGSDGAMYYNSSAGKFRCQEAGAWVDCITALPVSIVKTADQTISSATPANVSGLSFSVAANTKYYYKFVVKYTAASTSNGIGVGVTLPASPASSHWCAQTIATRNAATGGQWAGYCSTGDAAGGLSTYDAESTSDVYPTVLEGYLQTGASGGTVQLRAIYQEGNVVIKAGSFGIMEVVQ
jgi:parallel beta-helix repeat protein